MKNLWVLVVLVAMGGAASVSTAAPANEPQKVIKPDVQAWAKRISVNVFDLPGAGWSADPPSQSIWMAIRCPYYNPDQSRLTENGAYEVGYTREDGLYVSSTVGIYRSAKQGRAAYGAVVQPLLPRCFGERTAKASQPHGSVRLRSTRFLAFPRYGDRSTAFRLVFSNRSRKGVVPTTLDVVAINRGAVNTALLFTSPLKTSVPQSVERRIAGHVAARMAPS